MNTTHRFSKPSTINGQPQTYPLVDDRLVPSYVVVGGASLDQAATERGWILVSPRKMLPVVDQIVAEIHTDGFSQFAIQK